MPSAYDKVLEGIGTAPAAAGSQPSQKSAYDALFPTVPEGMPLFGYQPDRFGGYGQPTKTNAERAKFWTDSANTFYRELLAQAGNIGRGAQQIFNTIPLGDEAQRMARLAELAAEQNASDADMAAAREEHPVAAGLARGAPYAVAPQRAIPSIILGTLYEALKYGSPSERVTAGLGGAVSGGLSALGGAVGRGSVQPTRGGAGAQGLEGAAARLGAPLTAGQHSLNPRTLAFEDYQRRTPFGSIPFDKVNEAQRLAFNRAAAKAIGEQADALPQTVLAAAEDRIGSIYDDVVLRNSLKRTPELTRDVLAFKERLKELTGPDTRALILRQLEKYRLALKEHNGEIPGPVFREMGTRLNEMVKGGGDLGRWARELRQMMRSHMNAGLTGEDAALWKQADEQYRNLMRLIEHKYTVNETTGDVSAKGVASVLNSEGRAQKMGRVPGPLGAVATFGRGLPSYAVGSQTASRLLWNELREHPVQAITGIPLEYLPAVIFARGGLVKLHPQAAAVLSPTLGLFGKTTLPALPQGLLD